MGEYCIDDGGAPAGNFVSQIIAQASNNDHNMQPVSELL